MLKPLPEESQPQFATRFHIAMVNEIPSANQRNIACFNAWKNSPNHRSISRAAESRFPADQYRRVRNVHYFEEHELPGETLPDGSVTPPKKYSRSELAEMVNGMNSRIIDHEHFPPLSKGHTVLDKDGKIVTEPEVLGYTGPFYLGQVGDVSPRWGIFGDEYHLNEFVPELNSRRGRSPEVWPYKNARDQFFHPIAALGSEMPRGNLIPARYSRISPESGEPIVVEFYTATTAYGGNAAAPCFGHRKGKTMNPAQYGSAQPAPPAASPAPATAPPAPDNQGQDGGGDQSAQLVQEIIQGIMETPLGQFMMQLYQERQQQDSQTSMDGGSQFAADQASQAPPAVGPQPPAPPAPAAPPAAPPAPAPPASPPRQYSRQIEELQAELAATRAAADNERKLRQRVERYSRLNELASEYILDPDEEIERTASYSDDQFKSHCDVIVNRYSRNPTNVPDFHSLSQGSGANDIKPETGPASSPALTPEDMDKIGGIAKSKGLTYSQARDMYCRDRKTAV